MGKVVNRRKGILLVLFLILSLVCSGCSEKSTEKDSEKKTEQIVQEEKPEEVTEIPSDLIPGQEVQAQAGTDGQYEEGLEVVGEDRAVYTVSDPASGGSNGVDKNSGSNSGAGSTTDSSQSEVVQISFQVESSQADDSVSFAASITLDAGATVYDALAASGLSYSGKSYISEIGGLGEKMFGAQSGWKYYVNGSSPNKSCTNCVLKDGDKVQWSYVLKP